MEVFVTTYEVNEVGQEIMQAHIAALAAYYKAAFAVADRFGASGFRPRSYGPPATLLFKADLPPIGFKYVARDKSADTVECSPRLSTTIGKEAKAALDTVGKQPQGDDVARAFGWSPPEMAFSSSGIVYFPTAQTLELPAQRSFIRLPRFARDNWTQHPGLTAVPESEYMRAIEEHNAAARELRALAA